MMVNPDVGNGYIKNLNQRRILRGVLLIFNQLIMVLKLELISQNCFSVPNAITECNAGNLVVFFIYDLSTVLCFSRISNF